jgi:hypothetical protein
VTAPVERGEPTFGSLHVCKRVNTPETPATAVWWDADGNRLASKGLPTTEPKEPPNAQ